MKLLYTIVCEADPGKLALGVQALLNHGWELHGTLVVTSHTYTLNEGSRVEQMWFTREMVKQEWPSE